MSFKFVYVAQSIIQTQYNLIHSVKTLVGVLTGTETPPPPPPTHTHTPDRTLWSLMPLSVQACPRHVTRQVVTGVRVHFSCPTKLALQWWFDIPLNVFVS
jgi:hypothetical protein